MRFVQLIEFRTSQPDAVERLVAEWWTATNGRRAATRGTFTRDRDSDDTYIQVVEFPSYDAAMENSRLPETAALAERIAGLCDAPLAFRNLDVRHIEEG